MLKKIIILCCMLSFVLMGTLVFLFSWYGQKEILIDQTKDFTIPFGRSVKAITDQLYKDKVIEFPYLFEWLARFNIILKHKQIQAGNYRFQPSQTYKQLIDILIGGEIHYFKAKIIEGVTFNKLLNYLNNEKNLTDPINSQNKINQLINQLKLVKYGLEGQFYADTYFYKAGDSVFSILERAHHKLVIITTTLWKKRAKHLPYKNLYEALIVASIIEKETSAPFEREKISGVFTRRLKLGMRLQSDATVIYGMGSNYKGNITKQALLTKTAYNTYKINGLPPTPICMIGRASFFAALHPDHSDLLYFVAKGNGTHHFSTTFSEHKKAIEEYQIERFNEKNYHSDYRKR